MAPFADSRTSPRTSVAAAARIQSSDLMAPGVHKSLPAGVDIPVPGGLSYYQGRSNREVPCDVVAVGNGQAVAAAVHWSAVGEAGHLAGLMLPGLQLCRLRLALDCVSRGLQPLLEGQYQSGNQTYLTWLVLKLYLIVAVYVACSPQHGSTHAS